jgi:hypothetical protein
MNLEDKIQLTRGIIGIISGIISGILSLYGIYYSATIVILSYILSILIVIRMGASNKYDIYIRGSLVLYLSWFLILVLIYNY